MRSSFIRAATQNFGLQTTQCSRCSFSVLLIWVNAIKVWANAINMPDQHILKKRIFASYKMFRKGFEILMLSFIYQFPNTMFLCWSWILIALARTLIALAHLNSTEKLHWLQCFLFHKQEIDTKPFSGPIFLPAKRNTVGAQVWKYCQLCKTQGKRIFYIFRNNSNLF